MTLSASDSVNRYTAAADQTAFAYTFKILDEADIEVSVDGVVQGSGYTVSNVGNANGGNVTFSTGRTAGEVVALRRSVTFSQTVNLATQGSLDTDTLEESGLDRIVMMIQQLNEVDARSFKVPVNSAVSGSSLEVSPSGSQLVGWNSAGTALTNYSPSALSSSITPTSFGASLLDDADDAEARGTLNLPGAFSGKAGQVARVNAGETAFEYTTDRPFRSLLIGGVFATNPWQRGTSITAATNPTNNDGNYAADRWVLVSDGNDIVDITQDTDGSLKATVQTINKQFGFVQIVENANCAHVLGSVVSAAVRAKASGLATLRLAVLAWDNTADSVTSDVVGTWAGGGTEPTWATNWTREGDIVDLTMTTSYAEALSENISIDTASAANIAIVVWVDDTDGAVSDTLNLDWIGCVAGARWNGIERRSKIQELNDCLRYYWRINGTENYIASGWNVSTTVARVVVGHPVPMRVGEPTLQVSGATEFDVLHAAASTATTALSAVAQTEFKSGLAATVASGLTAGQGCALQLDNTAGNFLAFDAEL